MLPALTPAVSRALDLARRHALACGAAQVSAAHLVMALLEEEEGQAFEQALRAGLSRPEFEEWRGALPPNPSDAAGVPLDERLQGLLRQARGLAVELTGESTLSGEAVLLALLQEDQAVRADLEGLGLNLARLESQLQAQRPPLPVLEAPLRLVEPPEWVDSARILDAAANRAREALRVIEDYCRFVLDDGVLSAEVKQMRHDLAGALEDLPVRGLLAARETRRDVGTGISTPSERHRSSVLDVVQANLKRLQESLRSLEEHGKVTRPEMAADLEQLRYRAYTLEKALLLGTFARQQLEQVRLCVLLTGATCAAALDWTIEEAAAGGAGMIQLREKELPDRELIRRARDVRQWTRRAGVLFIVNDRPDVARLVEADGVHLGQDDLPVKEARRIVGPDALIGVSTHDLEQLRQAVLDGASYIGVGPCFASRTKHFEDLAGMDFVRQAVRETSLPAFAIGGISAQTIGEVAAAGARRVAVSAAVAGADDPQSAARTLIATLPAWNG